MFFHMAANYVEEQPLFPQTAVVLQIKCYLHFLHKQ